MIFKLFPSLKYISKDHPILPCSLLYLPSTIIMFFYLIATSLPLFLTVQSWYCSFMFVDH